MDKIKKLNLKKQIVSLKFCYEEQLLETRALISRIHNLESIFKITKQFIKEKKKNNFDLKNEKRYLLISSQKKTLLKNIDKQKKIFSKSILFNKYQELQKQKEVLIQTIEEKKNILNSIKNELNVYKLCHPFGSQVSTILLNNTLDSLFINGCNNKKNINNIDIDDNNNNDNGNDIKKKFKKIIIKEKLKLQKKCEETYFQLKNTYNNSMFNYQKRIKERGFASCFINDKYNKVYSFSIEPVRIDNNNNSSDDDDSNSENENGNNIIINNELNSINDRIFDNEDNKQKMNKTIDGFRTDKKKIINKSKHINDFSNSFAKNNNRNILIQNILSPKRIEFNPKEKIGLVTEIDNERTGELNRKLLKIKECYYECLDRRYELKNNLKTNIAQIYNIKEKIKKNKKENNNNNNNKDFVI